MLTFLKLLHTIVWAIMAAAFGYSIYAGFIGKTDWLLWSCLIMIGLEILVLLANGWVCPITTLAARHTDNREPNFDIFLPMRLAKHNKNIFLVIFIVGGLGILFRWLIWS